MVGEPFGEVSAVGYASEAERHLLETGGVQQDVHGTAWLGATQKPDEPRHGCFEHATSSLTESGVVEAFSLVVVDCGQPDVPDETASTRIVFAPSSVK